MTSKPTRRRWSLKLISVIVASLLALGAIAVLSLQRRVIFPRQYTQPHRNAGENVEGLVKIWIETPEGQVEGWFLPGNGVTADNPGPAALFAHGNAELIDEWTDEMAGYRRLGVSVFLAEFRGYGRSAGSPSQDKITDDFLAFYEHLIGLPQVDPTRIIFHGRSMGGGAVCALASHHTPAALILQSTFRSLRAMARRFFVPGFLVLDPFDNEAVVSQLDIPVLILHGENDDLIPYSHALELHRLAPNSQLITYQAGHNDCPPSWIVFWNDVEGFLRENGLIGE